MSPDLRAPQYNEADRQTGYQTVVPAQKARAGVIGNNVRYVLAFSLVAVIIAFVIVYIAYF